MLVANGSKLRWIGIEEEEEDEEDLWMECRRNKNCVSDAWVFLSFLRDMNDITAIALTPLFQSCIKNKGKIPAQLDVFVERVYGTNQTRSHCVDVGQKHLGLIQSLEKSQKGKRSSITHPFPRDTSVSKRISKSNSHRFKLWRMAILFFHRMRFFQLSNLIVSVDVVFLHRECCCI